jgi:hypothetical protein
MVAGMEIVNGTDAALVGSNYQRLAWPEQEGIP